MHEIQMLGLLAHDVLSSIEVPFLYEEAYEKDKEGGADLVGSAPSSFLNNFRLTKEQMDQFDNDIFSLKDTATSNNAGATTSIRGESLLGTPTPPAVNPLIRTPSTGTAERRRSHRASLIAPITPKIQTIDESPIIVHHDLPPETAPSTALGGLLSTSPSQSSIHSVHSARSGQSATSNLSRASRPLSAGTSKSSRESPGRSGISSKLNPFGLLKTFRSGPSQPQLMTISASASSTPTNASSVTVAASTTGVSLSRSSTLTVSSHTSPSIVRSIVAADKARNQVSGPVTISIKPSSSISRRSLTDSGRQRTPTGTPPTDELGSSHTIRRRGTISSTFSTSFSFSPKNYFNPSQQNNKVSSSHSALASRWQHIFATPLYKHNLKWKSIVIPGCLPLTVEYFPSASELETSYDVFSYDSFVDPTEMKSFMVKPPTLKGVVSADERRRHWALAVMRGMVAVRLAQGFQFVIQPSSTSKKEESGGTTDLDESASIPGNANPLGGKPSGSSKSFFHRSKSFMSGPEDDFYIRPVGACDILRGVESTYEPVYLSTSHEIHRISYTGETIQVRRYVRRMPPGEPFKYECLIWPKLGGGYTAHKTSFQSHGWENFNWNRYVFSLASRVYSVAHSISQIRHASCGLRRPIQRLDSILAYSLRRHTHSSTSLHNP
jgi:DEP domain-containing protein 5